MFDNIGVALMSLRAREWICKPLTLADKCQTTYFEQALHSIYELINAHIYF